MDEPDHLILIVLRRTDSKLDELRADGIEVKERLGLLDGGQASLSRRMDFLAGDVEQIRRRSDLVDAPT